LAFDLKVALAATIVCCGCRPDKGAATQAVAGEQPPVPATAAPDRSAAAAAGAPLASTQASVTALSDSAPPASDVGGMADAEYQLGSTRLKLGVTGDRCALTFGDESAKAVSLDLTPPCYLLVWNQPPPRLPNGRAESGGQPVGTRGEPMAWKYPTARGATVVAIIGDSVADSMREGSLFKTRQAQNFRCAGSLQGVKFISGTPLTTPKRHQTGVYCVETGLEEKDFWMLAHDKPR
jgi:hypothetical protein